MPRKQTRRAIYFTFPHYDWITAEAARRNMSRSALLEEIIDGALEKRTKDRPPKPVTNGGGYHEF